MESVWMDCFGLDCFGWTFAGLPGMDWTGMDCSSGLFGMDQIDGSFLPGELGFGISESGNLGVTRGRTAINLEGCGNVDGRETVEASGGSPDPILNQMSAEVRTPPEFKHITKGRKRN